MNRVHALARDARGLRGTSATALLLSGFLPALIALTACDKEPSRLDQLVEASTAPSSKPAETATAVAVVQTPQPIVVEPGRFGVGGSTFDTVSASAASDAAGACMKSACAKDGEVTIEAKRASKPSQIALLVAALHAAGAKKASIKTEGRDKVVGALAVTFAALPVPDCTTAAFIGKDGGIGVWHAGGGTAKKYNRGFAGPDMTLGSEGVRNAAKSCDSPILLVGADDAMIWGLVYDLVTIARAAPEGGAGLKPTEVAILQTTTPAGRKITSDDLK